MAASCLPILIAHGAVDPFISRRSQIRAVAHLRSIVASEMSSTSAISWVDKPPKSFHNLSLPGIRFGQRVQRLIQRDYGHVLIAARQLAEILDGDSTAAIALARAAATGIVHQDLTHRS
jgi:hypothetical protein